MIIDKQNVIVGFCNDGYFDFCKNWLISLHNVKLQDRVIVYALDDKSYNKITVEFPDIKCIRWDNLSLFSPASEKFIELVGEGWDVIMFKKLECVHYTLLQGHDVLYTDTDVVFQRDGLEYILDNIGDSDFVIQQDGPKDMMWCAGLFYAKTCPETLNLTILSPDLCKGFNCDQPILNGRLSVESGLPLSRVYSKSNVQDRVVSNGWSPSNSLKWHRLSEDLFPNGNKWQKMRHRYRKDAYLIHYNCITGYVNKVKEMKKHNHWYL